jgi:hypothetical protein
MTNKKAFCSGLITLRNDKPFAFSRQSTDGVCAVCGLLRPLCPKQEGHVGRSQGILSPMHFFKLPASCAIIHQY